MKILLTLAAALAFSAAQLGCSAAKPAGTASASQPAPGQEPPETRLVKSFYDALLQEDPPTFQQEKALFSDSSGLRSNILARTHGDPAQPVILQLFREHRDVFLPANRMSPAGVQVSSPFRFVRSLARLKDPHTSHYVIALFVNDPEAKPPRFRTIVFKVDDDGRLNPDGIFLDGFQGQLTYERFFVNPFPPAAK